MLAPRATAAPLDQFSPRRSGVGAVDHSVLAGLLHRYVEPSADGINRVNYRAWKTAPADLTGLSGYLRRLQLDEPARLTRAEQLAYWVNLYNAETLRAVLAAYPVRTILLVRPMFLSIGPWRAKTLRIAGSSLSLDDVENAILRPLFGDPRVHYALNCASLGCPNLRRDPWGGVRIEEDLDAAAKEYVNHPRGVRASGQHLQLSSIYKWYRPDFGGADAAVLSHLARYAEPPLRAALRSGARITSYHYDWMLNDAARG